MSSSIDLAGLVLAKIEDLGLGESAKYFGVSIPTVSAWKASKNFPNLTAGQKVLDELFAHKPPELWDLKGKKLIVLLPIYRSFNPVTHITLFRNYAQYGPEKIGLIPKLRTLIVEARNMLAQMFLLTDSEWCLFVDDDLALPCANGAMLRGLGCNLPEPNASLNAISRIMSHPPEYTIVSGLYYGRNSSHKAQVSSAFDSPVQNARLNNILKTGGEFALEEQRWCATGFLRVHRSVFEDMTAKADELFPQIKPASTGRHFGFFTPDGPDAGEDSTFGKRAALCGHKSWLDPTLLLGHCGETVY
jgi:hypothetical protein